MAFASRVNGELDPEFVRILYEGDEDAFLYFLAAFGDLAESIFTIKFNFGKSTMLEKIVYDNIELFEI